MTEYEYGIDWKKVDRRDDTPHRSGMTLEQAEAFLVNDAHDNFKWSDIFIIVRRKIGFWEDLPVTVKFPDGITVVPSHKPGCRCMSTSPPFVDTQFINDIIGKDCLPADPIESKFCGNGGCGSSAGSNGYCGPNGCYNYPG